jgi:hypothetical protein
VNCLNGANQTLRPGLEGPSRPFPVIRPIAEPPATGLTRTGVYAALTVRNSKSVGQTSVPILSKFSRKNADTTQNAIDSSKAVLDERI